MLHSSPTFSVYTGCMFSSKTTAMLMALERFKYQNKRIIAFKPAIDDRYGKDEIVSHSGWRHPAICVKDATEVLQHLSNAAERPDVVAVDELFMINGIADVLIWLFQNGFSIVAATIDLSAQGKAWCEVEKVLPWATKIEKCVAVCTVCGRDAAYTHKKQVSDETSCDQKIVVGGADVYEPRCAFHHPFVMNHAVISAMYRE